MTPEEAKTILLLYRPGTIDAGDPEVAAALSLAKQDPELTRWLVEHFARQEAVRAGFRKITVPAGLKEQIISEQAAKAKAGYRRPAVFLAVAVVLVALAVLAPLWFQSHRDDAYASLRDQLASVALRGYGMDLVTDDSAQVRAYLARQNAPSDYVLPAPLGKTAVSGCAIEDWRGAKVSLVCFRTGKSLPPGVQSDLWLYVIDRAAVKNAPPAGEHRFARVSRLMTVAWTEGDKLYVLGTVGDEQTLRQYL